MRFHITCLAIGALALGGCTAVDLPSDLTNIQREEALLAAVVSPARPAEHIAQDAQRQPLETMLFAGVAEGQSIAEIAPDDGYYTRLLAQAVGSTGRIYVMLPTGDASSTALFQPLAEQYGNVEIVSDLSDLSMPEGLNMLWDVAGTDKIDAPAYATALGGVGILYLERTTAVNPINDEILEYFTFDGQLNRTDSPISGLKYRRR